VRGGLGKRGEGGQDRQAEQGRALGPVVAALRDWGAHWTEGPDHTKIAHRPCGHPISVRLYCPDCDRQVTGAEIAPVG
jgi:hypothetical protein